MGKTKRGLKPSSSSKAVGPKQKRAKLSAQRATELSGSQILATLRKAGEYIYSSETLMRIAKSRDCLSKVLVKIRS